MRLRITGLTSEHVFLTLPFLDWPQAVVMPGSMRSNGQSCGYHRVNAMTPRPLGPMPGGEGSPPPGSPGLKPTVLRVHRYFGTL